MRFLPLALAGVLLVAPSAPAADDAEVAVTKWLVLPAVDPTPRRTLRADAVFAKYLLDRASPPPKGGDEVTGTLGKPAKWAARAADEKGEIDGEGVAWAYASVESPADRVVLAKLDGAGVLYVNGAGFTGDVYDIDDFGVPVALRKGANDVYVAVPRGRIRLTLCRPISRGPTVGGIHREFAEKMWLDSSRSVVPDRVEGETSQLPHSIGRMLNVTTEVLRAEDGTPWIVPLGVQSVSLASNQSPDTGEAPKKPTDARRRTFVSDIDGSVQSYALLPPAPSDVDKSKIGVVLSLHGAGVDCMDQARAYAPKPDFWIVCPTNRGRFGFDWQDWGRLDAYEVLADALKVTGVDPRRVYLTGHSMGGHGTWNLAANDPGRFLAIAPCSGWSSFESYGAPRAVSPLGRLWRAADGASRTLELVDNLAQVPAFVLHGEADEIVPASEARLMIDAIEKAGGHPQSHFEPGARHWWDKDEKTPGADCVDWPAIWELFRRTQPSAEPPSTVSFATMDLDVNHSKDWITIDQPIEYGKPSRVTATCDAARRFTISTENVRKFDVLASQAPGKGIATYVVDGKTWPAKERGYGDFERGDDGTWGAIDDVGALMQRIKLPHRSGPFKRAFTNRFVLVYGTGGDDVEDRELLEMARYDSEVWAYRANGDANLMSDAQFLAGDFKDRNVIVYGNADTNRAWSAVFDDDCPIVAKRGAMTVNGTKHEGVVAAAFVRLRKGSDIALAAAFADTGPKATRLFYEFLVFSSGIGIPDYVVFGPGFLSERDGDVRAAGWFDYAWRMR